MVLPITKLTFPHFSSSTTFCYAYARPSKYSVCCMVIKINLDCNACCRKMRRVILRMKEIETHEIEKQHSRVIVCGRFIPADVAIKMRKKMNRRVEILEIQGLSDGNDGHTEQEPAPNHVPEENTMPNVPRFQFPEHHPIAQHA